MKKVIFLLFIIFGLYADIFAQDDFEFMQLITPKDYFSSGNISYYYGGDGGLEFWFDNSSIITNSFLDIKNTYAYTPSFKKYLNNIKEVLYLSDGTVVIYRTNDDNSCYNNPENNCLYSPLYIRKVNKKSLTGNISLYRIDKSIPLTEKDIINFPLGAVLYSMVVESPAYDFSVFTEFDSLVCIKNEEEICKGVINQGEIDKTALFELDYTGKDNGFMYKDTGESLVYKVDLGNNILTPYNKSCILSQAEGDDFKKCEIADMPKGSIKQFHHPNGYVYWQMYFNNPLLDNIIYWINERGEPFEVYTNSHLVYNFSLFNSTASELIMDKITQKNNRR